MEFTYENIKQILIDEDFSLLKDRYEDELIDVKEYPYDLSGNYGKEELCKDVSAMLNNQGGFILLGVRGEPVPNHNFERIEKVRGITGSINEQQYQQCLNNGMHPEGAWASLKKCKLDGKDVFYIEIPRTSDKPFFRKKGDDFQYWIRSGAYANQLSIERLHEISKKGLEYENHLVHIESTLDELVKQSKINTRPPSLDNLKKQL